MSVISKLCILGMLKFSTLDPYGMGIEMEGGKPGWNDAMNGLPGNIIFKFFLLLPQFEKCFHVIFLYVEYSTECVIACVWSIITTSTSISPFTLVSFSTPVSTATSTTTSAPAASLTELYCKLLLPSDPCSFRVLSSLVHHFALFSSFFLLLVIDR